MADLSPDLSRVIDGYVPSGVRADTWASVADDVRSWVGAAVPGHRRRALQLLYAAAHLAAWCDEQAIPVTTAIALRLSTIERFCAAAERDGRYSATTRATIRSRLRCLADANCVVGNPPQPPRLSRQRVRPPYDDQEVAGYFALARAQSSPTRCQRLLALLCAGLGAGLAPQDYRDLRGTDVAEGPGSRVVVHVRGERPRQVPVLEAYASELAAIAQATGNSLLLGGSKPDRRNVTSGLLHSIDGDPGLSPLDPRRLRSTWLVTLLRRRVRLDVLLAAAGLESPASLGDLVGYLSEPEEDAFSQLADEFGLGPEFRGRASTGFGRSRHA